MERRRLLHILPAAPALLGAGCAARKKTNGALGIEQVSSAVVFRGYRNSVTVDATPDRLSEMFKTPDDVMKWGIFNHVSFASGTDDFREPGSQARIIMTVGGVVWNILFTNIRHTISGDGTHEIWFVGTNPTVHVQKWTFAPQGDGSKVTLRFYGEPPSFWGLRKIDWTDVVDVFINLFDTALMNLANLFAPSFDRKAHLASGGSGDIFDVIFQRFAAEFPVSAPAGKAYHYLSQNDRFSTLLGDGSDVDCLSAKDSENCPFKVKVSGRSIGFDSFLVKRRPGMGQTRILTWDDYITSVELSASPRFPFSSRARAVYTMELPEQRSELAVDLTIGISRIPDKMAAAALSAKRELETGPLGSSVRPVQSIFTR